MFKAGIQFSGPADQNTQIYSTAVPFGCATPFCTFPVTDALVQLVVPPYDNANVCVALTRPGTRYGTDGFGILAHETAYHAQQRVKVPLLNVYSADDSLVPAFEAEMMADEVGNALQRTLEVTSGEHAYFFDRWWQQRAILLYFKGLLPRLPAAPRLRRHQPSTRRQADPRSASSSCRSRRTTHQQTRTSRLRLRHEPGETQS